MKHLSIKMIILFSPILFILQACSDTAPSASTPNPTQPPSTENGDSPPLPIEEYVRQTFIGGLPYEETLNTYNPSDVPILLAMLNDPNEQPYWANIVIALNIIGDEEIEEPLINFINSGVPGNLSRPHYAAKTSALLSMGYLINHTKSETALTYLIESLDPTVWQERGTTGIGPFQSTLQDTHIEFSKQALLGLSLSGNPTAADALRTFQASDPTGQQATFHAAVLDLIPEALETNQEIANIGLVNYYRNNR